MSAPRRIQRLRTLGWKAPVGAVYVGRPTVFGNPFTVAEYRTAGFPGTDAELATRCTEVFRVWISTKHWRLNWDGPDAERARAVLLAAIPSLRGKTLMCWCPLDRACHADVLLKLANAPEAS